MYLCKRNTCLFRFGNVIDPGKTKTFPICANKMAAEIAYSNLADKLMDITKL